MNDDLDNAMTRMFALHEIVPPLVAANDMGRAKYDMLSGISGLLDGVQDDIQAMFDA